MQSFTHNRSVSNSITSHCQPWVRFYQNHLSTSHDNSCDIQNHLVTKNRPAVQMSWADVSTRQRYWIVDETIVRLTEGEEWKVWNLSPLFWTEPENCDGKLLCGCARALVREREREGERERGRERESKRASVKTKKKSRWISQHKSKSRNKVVREARWEM